MGKRGDFMEKKDANLAYVLGIVAVVAVSGLVIISFGKGDATVTGAAAKGKYADCTMIPSGELYASDGSLIMPGYNEWGYNYQAHLFNGMYCDYHPVYRPGGPSYEWCQENYGDVKLLMYWNDAWLSNKDCDGDGLLDRHYGYDSYIGSGAWETNHMWGTYEIGGETCKWDYFVKIVAAPADAYKESGYWYESDGTLIGEDIWGEFAIIQQVENDPCAGYHGVSYHSPASSGFGYYQP
ncbi:hypothetical protein KY347_00970 [Candidatus Woesearchaeota archaeon]|nr:hypothetical protein [Candidatus Woesearchaeota archaeon]